LCASGITTSKEGEVVTEREDALGLGDLGVLAEARAEQRLGHRRHVLVAEAHVGPHEERVAGRTAGTPKRRCLASAIARGSEDLLRQRHRARGVSIAGGATFAGEALARL
jgi:hypothetical protein